MPADLAKLEAHLASCSYIEGYTPSQADVHVFKALGSEPSATEFPNSARWYRHIASYSTEHASLPGSSSAGEAFTAGTSAAAAPAAKADDDDDVDLFGSDEEEDEEAERIKAERVKAYNEKKAAKPKTVAKSLVTLEVKPWDDETDLQKLEEAVRSIEKPGLVWGASKLVPIGFGIKKLQITIVIEDDLVSLDELQEQIQEFEDYVQSTDVAAMQTAALTAADPSRISSEFVFGNCVINAVWFRLGLAFSHKPFAFSQTQGIRLRASSPTLTFRVFVERRELWIEHQHTGVVVSDSCQYRPPDLRSTCVSQHDFVASATIDPFTHTDTSAAVESQSDATRSISPSVLHSFLSIFDLLLILPFHWHRICYSSSIVGVSDAIGSSASAPATTTSHRRTRTDFEPENNQFDYSEDFLRPSAAASSSSFYPSAGEQQPARKRPRLDDHTSTRPYLYNLTHPPSPTLSKPLQTMRLVENDNSDQRPVSLDSDSPLTNITPRDMSASDGLSTLAASQVATNGNSFNLTNGGGSAIRDVAVPVANGRKHSKSPDASRSAPHVIPRVHLPGTRLFEESCIDRQEFVRLVIQSLRDVGYLESASTLEAESGYQMEAPGVSQFRSYILNGRWADAESSLPSLGVNDEENLRISRFLISQQKYLELLELQSVNAALHVLRNELAPLNVDVDELHSLSSLIMCSNAEDLRQRAKWDGAAGTSRRTLLSSLQRFISPSIMMPQRRFAALIEQAFAYQRTNCLYHNTPYAPESFSLYTDHRCSREDFPLLTTNILKEHTDEVWNIKWSHDGQYLASASRDKSAFIWLIGKEIEPNVRECALERKLRDHNDSVGCLAWSPNDTVLLTSTDSNIKIWNVKHRLKSGLCLRELDSHEETVSALEWLPDGSGFLSAGLDRKIILWDADGSNEDLWVKSVRVTDLAIAPDLSKMVVVGLECLPMTNPKASTPQQEGQGLTGSGVSSQQSLMANTKENRVIIYDYATRLQEVSVRLEGELTSVKISQDSRYALINQAPDEVQLWDLESARMVRKFTGQRQGQHVIRSCFGGVDGNFIVSGSEDGNVYVWHRDTGVLLEVLTGHGSGSVNAVAWNPTNERMFASCSDDWTIRIWESPHASLLGMNAHILRAPQDTERENKKGKAREASGLAGPSSLISGLSV
ncbi:hypothetical protein ACEPAH_5019 [Sanghuangporus vaninii]